MSSEAEGQAMATEQLEARIAALEAERNMWLGTCKRQAVDLADAQTERDKAADAYTEQGHELFQVKCDLADALRLGGDVYEAANLVMSVVGFRNRRNSCPHGNSAASAPNSWWCDECLGALEDALPGWRDRFPKEVADADR